MLVSFGRLCSTHIAVSASTFTYTAAPVTSSLKPDSTVLACLCAVRCGVPQVTFAFYAGVAKNEMNPALVFTALALFNSLRIPLMMCKGPLSHSSCGRAFSLFDK